ncbi:MAG: 3-deoxy-D-manno-octulosonic acid transferase [Candidatus Electrothrix aestuarii]|uniref:3-deoxy-D-manno-octulosonic acid transferase n=1 Tax=Candidatus Electrothrix aestuarii TaxID=3062594 RepID=A0AAU8LSH0_9BACT|nr:3-deoxy-D-manno-octulosonic acid transferase [Candidatus Electrothrix aestuarii]
MLFLYNLLIIVLGVFLFPVFLLIILSREKYRGRTLERLGLTVGKIRRKIPLPVAGAEKTPVIWLHALSVGEVTSALPFIKELRTEMPEAFIVLTVATSSGKKTAENLLSSYVQVILSSPFDLRFAVRRYIKVFQPDCFIQVETDFWPNWLDLLHEKGIPAMLVNGRISEKSFATYLRFGFFFRPMFCAFNLLSMQTAEDRRKMIELGVPPARVLTLGNLKYDMKQPAYKRNKREGDEGKGGLNLLTAEKAQSLIWVCGSTHPGEEEVLFAAFAQLLAQHTEQAFLVLAPRDIKRGQELVEKARSFGLAAGRRSREEEGEHVLILDTLGELAQCYGQAHIAFVGGSLVPQGGHNPIEPALHGVPVLFGPHMEDFSEIADELMASGGGKMVAAPSLYETLAMLCGDARDRAQMGKAAQDLVDRHRGGVQRHVLAVRGLLS